MESREEYIENFRRENGDKIRSAVDQLRGELGGNAGKIDSLLADQGKIGELIAGLSDSDFSRLRQVLDHPEILNRILKSEKAKQNLARILEEL